MQVAVTGATGFVGRRLVAALGAAGDDVVALVRAAPGRDLAALADGLGGASVRAYEPLQADSVRAGLAGCEAVVNLAGESLLGGRWSAAFVERLRASRVETTRALVEALRGSEPPVRVLVSASAVGYYGPCAPHEVRTEDSAPGRDLLARLCVDWEQAASAAEAGGTRVVRLRLGVVLGRGGGALAQMERPFRLGLGGRLGRGDQVWSWIHVDDAVGLVRFALEHEDVRGPLNATAPEPVDNAAFTRALARTLHRPALLTVPAFAVRLRFGRGADALLSGQRVHPRAALDAGYRFRHPGLDDALADLQGEK
jgi:hypothetical protein